MLARLENYLDTSPYALLIKGARPGLSGDSRLALDKANDTGNFVLAERQSRAPCLNKRTAISRRQL